MLETKVLINSTISGTNKSAQSMCAEINDYYLARPIECEEYMQVKLNHIPLDIQVQYNLSTKVTPDDYIYIKIKRGMYGKMHAAVLAYVNLKTCLTPYVHSPVVGTAGMW